MYLGGQTYAISNRKFFFLKSQKTNTFSKVLSTIFRSMISVKKNQEYDWTNCTDVKMVWTLPRMMLVISNLCTIPAYDCNDIFYCPAAFCWHANGDFTEEVRDIFRLEKVPFPFSVFMITRFRTRTNDRSEESMNMRLSDMYKSFSKC